MSGRAIPNARPTVANAIADSLIAAVDAVAPASDEGEATVTARSIDPASPAAFQTSPNKQQDAVLGAIVGFLVASVAVVLGGRLDTRVWSASALKAITGAPGARDDRADARRLGPETGRDPAAQRQRGRGLPTGASGLRFASASHQTRTLAITSSRPAEGKTWTAADLAFVLAETGKRVLLIHADLRKPKVADAFGIIGTVGLTPELIDAIPLPTPCSPGRDRRSRSCPQGRYRRTPRSSWRPSG